MPGTRFAAIRVWPARAMRMQVKKGGFSRGFARGEMRQRAPCTSRSLKGSPRLRGSRGGITGHRTYLRPTRGSNVVFRSLAYVSSALALVVTRATAPLGSSGCSGSFRVADAPEARGVLDRRVDRPSKHDEE